MSNLKEKNTQKGRLIFITCMPMSSPKAASMYYMKILLDRHSDLFTWFSLRRLKNEYNIWKIPYSDASPIYFPKSFSNIRRFVNLYPWAFMQGLKAAWFGWKNNIGIVYSDLAFEAVITGRIVSKILNVPLVSSIHDDPVNRLEKKDCPKWILSMYKKSFSKTLKYSSNTVVISDYMGKYYNRAYGISTITLFPGLEKKDLLPIKPFPFEKKNIIIGAIGSINCMKNWELLIKVCEKINKVFEHRKINIIHVGEKPHLAPKSNIVNYLGFVKNSNFKERLAMIDIGFLNWDFTAKARVTVETSLPLKINSYIQAGVPMLALGPIESSIVKFVKDNKCGLYCIERKKESLYNVIIKFINNIYIVNDIQHSITDLRQEYSRDRFHSQFLKVINL